MVSRGGFDVKAGGVEAVLDLIVGLSGDDPDKALVLAHVAALVADGFAVWEIGGNGEIEVRFHSGETYLLAEATILRLA